MKMTLWDKRIPTLLGLFIVLIAVFTTTIFTQYGMSLLTKASPEQIPKDVKITNVTDTSFTVTWLTGASQVGSIKTGETEESGNTIIDDRDLVAGTATPSKIHSVTTTNLRPKSKYFFKIASGQNLYDNNGAPFAVITAPSLTEDAKGEMSLQIAGSVLTIDGKPSLGTIVFFNVLGAQPLSTIVKDSGEYLLTLTSLRAINLASYHLPSPDQIVELTTIGRDGTSSKTRLLFKNSSKIPSITLGKNYDFTQEQINPTPKEASSSSSFTIPKAKETKEPTILSPKKNEIFTDQKPSFRGVAKEGTTIKITIKSEPIEDTVTADSNGTWTYRPKNPLPSGTHTITVEAPDQNGIVRILTQTFTIQPLGSQVVEAATPSATPTVGVSPTATPSATPTISPVIAPSPTPIASPSATLTLTPSFSPTPTPTIAPIPVSATVFPSLFLGAFGAFLSLLGISLLVFKK